jgi:hypothetical protein
MMYVAYTGLSAPVRDNIIAGAAIDDARNTVNNRESLVDRELNQGSDQR